MSTAQRLSELTQEWNTDNMAQWFEQLPYEGKLGAIVLCHLINPQNGFHPMGWRILRDLESSVLSQACPEPMTFFKDMFDLMRDENPSEDMFGGFMH